MGSGKHGDRRIGREKRIAVLPSLSETAECRACRTDRTAHGLPSIGPKDPYRCSFADAHTGGILILKQPRQSTESPIVSSTGRSRRRHPVPSPCQPLPLSRARRTAGKRDLFATVSRRPGAIWIGPVESPALALAKPGFQRCDAAAYPIGRLRIARNPALQRHGRPPSKPRGRLQNHGAEQNGSAEEGGSVRNLAVADPDPDRRQDDLAQGQ